MKGRLETYGEIQHKRNRQKRHSIAKRKMKERNEPPISTVQKTLEVSFLPLARPQNNMR